LISLRIFLNSVESSQLQLVLAKTLQNRRQKHSITMPILISKNFLPQVKI